MRSNILRNRAMFCSQVSTPPITSTPLCFEAEEANSTVYYSVIGTLATLNMKYSTDGTTWTAFVS